MQTKSSGTPRFAQTFKVRSVGVIAGCIVRDGLDPARRQRPRKARRRSRHDSSVSSLKHLKDDVKEAKTGFDCGITLANFQDYKEGRFHRVLHARACAVTSPIPLAPFPVLTCREREGELGVR